MTSSAHKWLQHLEAVAILPMRPVFQLHDQMCIQLKGCPKVWRVQRLDLSQVDNVVPPLPAGRAPEYS